MDPLSITASVAGVITLVQKLTSEIYVLQQSVGSAPESARRIKEEVEGTRMVLTQVEHFINSDYQGSAINAHLIHLKDLLQIISDCVLTFNALDSLMDDLIQPGSRFLTQVRRALKEKEILKTAERLGRLQITLGLMMSISNRYALSILEDAANFANYFREDLSHRLQNELTSRNYQPRSSSGRNS